MPLSEDQFAEAVRGVLAVPLHRALGLELADDGDPTAGLVLTVAELSANNVGILHGGLVPLVLDVSAYLAVLPTLEPGTNAVTASTTAQLLRPASAGARLTVRGEIDRRGRALVFCSARATDEAGRTVATGQIVKSIVRS